MSNRKYTQTLVDGIVKAIKDEGNDSSFAPRVAFALEKMSRQAKEETEASVQSSVRLEEDEVSAIKKAVEALVGHPVDLSCTVNPELVSGLRINVGDWVLDTSFEGQLRKMADLLL